MVLSPVALMSVYTIIEESELTSFLSNYDVGELVTTKDPEEFKAIITDRINNSTRDLHYWT
jgi:flagellar basal body-associated protein FliL